MSRITRTESSLRDLDDIWDYIAIENHHPADADRLIDEIDKILHLLLTHPQMGEAVEHLRSHTRRCIVQNHYLLFYDTVGDEIRLLRVLHAARLIRPEDLQV